MKSMRLRDAASDLPPVANLHKHTDLGADVVCFSGGKAIRGPQGTGILCGRRDLIASAALQQLDMDVRPETWILCELAERLLPDSPVPFEALRAHANIREAIAASVPGSVTSTPSSRTIYPESG